MPTLCSHVHLSLLVGQGRRAASHGDAARALSAGEAWAAADTWRRLASMVLVCVCAERAPQSELHRKKTRTWVSFEQPDALDCCSCETADVESRDLLWKFHGLLDRMASRGRIVFIPRRVV